MSTNKSTDHHICFSDGIGHCSWNRSLLIAAGVCAGRVWRVFCWRRFQKCWHEKTPPFREGFFSGRAQVVSDHQTIIVRSGVEQLRKRQFLTFNHPPSVCKVTWNLAWVVNRHRAAVFGDLHGRTFQMLNPSAREHPQSGYMLMRDYTCTHGSAQQKSMVSMEKKSKKSKNRISSA